MVDVRENCKRVEGRVAQAAAKTGRSLEDISIVAVTKTRTPQEIGGAIAAGFCLIGENRIQETEAKKDQVSGDARWHLVGHLQSNKARKAVSLFDLVQSVDSVRVAAALNRSADDAGKTLDVLVQINTSGAAQQSGLQQEQAEEVVGQLVEMPRLRLRGLMTIGAFVAEENVVRDCFARLRKLRDELSSAFPSAGVDLKYLSMGMSGDFELAIAEGANMVRLGSTIFGPRV